MLPPPDTPAVEVIDHLGRHQAQIRRLVRRLVAPADAADVEQELYVAALERPPRALIALPAWITTTIRNLAAKRLRSAGRREARERGSAPREPLPSTAEIAARVELAEFLMRCVRELPGPERDVVLRRFFEERSTAEVARELGLGESTVRARLARAVERLRARLDERSGGERERWVRALLPWSLPGAGAATLAVATIAKFAAAVLLTTFAAAAFVTTRAGTRAPTADPSAAPAAVAFEAAAPAAPLAPTPEAVRVADAARELTPEPGAPTASLQPGHLRIQVVDAESRAEFRSASIRCLSATRFAEHVGSGRRDFVLTSGHWSVAVSAEGYEPELREVDLAAGATIDLGTIALVRGVGVIEGQLFCEGVDDATLRFVELRGEGRSPCPRCSVEPPSSDDSISTGYVLPDPRCCGYEWDRSVVKVGRDGRFRFGGLAAGHYFLRPLDDRPRLQPTLRVELARGEARFVELHLRPEVALRIECVDELGQPFVGRWVDDFHEEVEPIHVNCDVDGVLAGMDLRAPIVQLRAAIGPPRHVGEPGPQGPISTFTPAGVAAGPIVIGLPGAAEDRERGADDALFPVPSTPGYAMVEFAAAQLAPNQYLLLKLPATRVVARARCGDFAAGNIELDLADERQRTARLVFRPDPR